MTVTKETIIGDILDACPDTAPFFFEIGMHCLGCPASRGESIEDAWARFTEPTRIRWLQRSTTFSLPTIEEKSGRGTARFSLPERKTHEFFRKGGYTSETTEITET